MFTDVSSGGVPSKSGRTILVGESATLLREALKVWLETIPVVAQVYAVGRSDECLEMALQLSPDLVLLPSGFDGEPAVRTAMQMKQHNPHLKIAFWLGEISDLLLCDILASRPVGVVSTRESPDQIIRTIEQLLEGVHTCSDRLSGQVRRIQDHLARSRGRKDIIGLTARQKEVLRFLAQGHSVKEVLRFLAQGHSVKEVATKMHLSAKSVDSHKYRIMKKLGIHDRVHLTRFAIREGLLEV